MTKKIYHEPFKKCPGSLCFTLLREPIKVSNNQNQNVNTVTLFSYSFVNRK